MPHAESGRKPRRQWAPDARALGVVGDRWLMVIVRDLASGPLRLDALRRWLPGVSAGALEARLVRMAEAGLLVRRRHRSLPPRVDLELTPRGHALAQVIAELAHWELRTHWSEPQADEWVDVGACFRLAPFLRASEAHPTKGELALAVIDGRQRDEYAYELEQGRAKVEHRPAPEAQASIEATQDAWVQALGPKHDHTGLKVSGDTKLAESFLDLFAPQE